MKKLLLILLIGVLSINNIFAYTQEELDSKKTKYMRLIQNKIGKKIDALSDKTAKKLITLIGKQLRKTKESDKISDAKKLNKIALLSSLKDILENKISVEFIQKIGTGSAVEQGDVVSVDYTLKLSDGTIVDTSIGKVPFTFVIGQGQVIEGWETGMIGRKNGENFSLVIQPEQGYGEHDSTNVSVVTKKSLQSFVDNGIELIVGAHLPTQFGTFPIISIDGDNVTIDANHSLAGKTLYFDIEIKRIDKIKTK